MNAKERIKAEAKALLESGSAILTGVSKEKQITTALKIEYEGWFTRASLLVRQLEPHRYQDFYDLYRNTKAKGISISSYGIHDFIMGIVVKNGFDQEVFSAYSVFYEKFLNQVAIVRGIVGTFESSLRDIHTTLRAELFDDDLEAAHELLKAGHLRPAGVLAGVVLEAHLKSVCAGRNFEFKKKNLTVSDLNDRLKEEKVYDVPDWRFIQHLADVRNLACHRGERDPKREEIEDLVAGVTKILKTVA